jgi:hypothetical protein
MVMAKKKVKKTKKTKTKKKVVRKKKVSRKKKIARKASVTSKKMTGEKVVGMVDHFFGHISVAAFKVKNPLKVGDMIHVKGHTTDFVQRVDSIQSNHNSIPMAKKGVEVGIKVKGKCRTGDMVFIAAKEQAVVPKIAEPMIMKKPLFPRADMNALGQEKRTPAAKKPASYDNKKFLSF